MFLGLEGTGVVLAYVCTILAALLCIIYGLINWNKPVENEKKEIEEEAEWEKHEPEVVEAGGVQ